MEAAFFLALNALLTLVLLLVFFLTWRKTGIWFNPASLLSAAWVIYIAIPLIVGIGYPLNSAAVAYITVFVIFFSFSTFLFRWKPLTQRNEYMRLRGGVLSTPFLTYFFWIFVLSSLALHALDLVLQGFSISTDILTIGGQYAERRYAGTLSSNPFSKIALLTSFQSAILGGIIFGRRKSFLARSLILVAAFLPSSAVMLIQSAKGLFFLSAAFFMGGWLVARTYAADFHLPRVRLTTALISFSSVFSLVAASFIARFGFDFELLRYYFASYSSGHLYAFSDWFSDRYFGMADFEGYDQPSLEGGFYTFMGFFQALGDTRPVPLGVYDEFFEIPGLLMTNIYTAFRGLIADFGLLGSLALGAFLGLCSSVAFHKLLSSRNSPLACTIFIFSLGLIYQSYGISSFTWMSIPASFMLTYFILTANRLITPTPHLNK